MNDPMSHEDHPQPAFTPKRSAQHCAATRVPAAVHADDIFPGSYTRLEGSRDGNECLWSFNLHITPQPNPYLHLEAYEWFIQMDNTVVVIFSLLSCAYHRPVVTK